MRSIALQVWLLFAVVAASANTYYRMEEGLLGPEYSDNETRGATLQHAAPVTTGSSSISFHVLSYGLSVLQSLVDLFASPRQPRRHQRKGVLVSTSSLSYFLSFFQEKTRKRQNVSFGEVDVQITEEEKTLSDFEQRSKEFMLCVAARSGDLEAFRRHLTEYKTIRGIEFELDEILRFEHDPYKSLLSCAICGDNVQLLQETLVFHQITAQHLIPNYMSAKDAHCDHAWDFTRRLNDTEQEFNSLLAEQESSSLLAEHESSSLLAEHESSSLLAEQESNSLLAEQESSSLLAEQEYVSGLREAAQAGSLQVAIWLIDNGARDTSPHPYESAIHAAAAGKHVQMVKLLLEKGGSNVNAINDQERTPLHLAVESASVKTVKALLSHGASVSMADKKGNTALHFAAVKGFARIAVLLLDHKASVSAQNNRGNTPLHLAVGQGCIVTVNLFLKHGALVSTQDHLGNTPLHWAATFEHEDIVPELRKHGALVMVQNPEGKTPLDIAKDGNFLNIIQALTDDGKHGTEHSVDHIIDVRDECCNVTHSPSKNT